jgi:hypothetical protein
MWFGLLRTIPSGGVEQRELPALSRLSKRAVRQMVGAATRLGWIETLSGAGQHATLGLTPFGQEAATRWAKMSDVAERRWSTRVDAEGAALRAALARLVGQFDLELPHYPISYGSADFSVTGGSFRSGQLGPPRIPAHGQDWAPVVRADGDTTTGLGLTALLSRLLVAFAIDYTEAGGAALVIVEGLVRGFGTKNTVPMKKLPPVLGVNGLGKSALERHGVVSIGPDPNNARGRLAHLSTLGQRVRDQYDGVVHDVESDWADRFGRSNVATIRHTLETMLPAFHPGHPDALVATYVPS